MITLELDDSKAQRGLAQLLHNATDTRPMMKGLVVELEEMTSENFKTESWGGEDWADLKYPREGHYKKLYKSGELADSITGKSTGTTAQIGTNMIYAAIQHLGGKTSAHKISPKNKQALAFGGFIVKSVNHPGSDIDARPYLPINGDGELQSDGAERLLDVTIEALKKGVQS